MEEIVPYDIHAEDGCTYRLHVRRGDVNRLDNGEYASVPRGYRIVSECFRTDRAALVLQIMSINSVACSVC